MNYSIEIAKQGRVLTLHSSAGIESRHPVQLGVNAAADKAVEGDGATPIGEFYICAKNPRSKFFLSLCISYPNAAHATRGLEGGLIDRPQYEQILEAVRLRKMPPQHTRLGGEIYIHGQRQDGATRGCVALDNEAMQELYDRVDLGTPVIIRP
jgi:murein L,D-transpeptidase YafK